MTRPWEQPMTGAFADQVNRLHAVLPAIDTARLHLRPARIEDHVTYAAIYGGPRWHHDGPVTDEDVWLDFCQLVAGWMLRGIGLMTIEGRETGETLGFVLINHEYGDPEMELGWMLTHGAEGKGIAFEAASALRDHGRRMGLVAPVSYIAPGNAKSIRLAERLGARREPADRRQGLDPDCLVYRHPRPEEAQ